MLLLRLLCRAPPQTRCLLLAETAARVALLLVLLADRVPTQTSPTLMAGMRLTWPVI